MGVGVDEEELCESVDESVELFVPELVEELLVPELLAAELLSSARAPGEPNMTWKFTTASMLTLASIAIFFEC